jgi:hypothetical protein
MCVIVSSFMFSPEAGSGSLAHEAKTRAEKSNGRILMRLEAFISARLKRPREKGKFARHWDELDDALY